MIILLPLGAVNNNAQYIGAKSTKYESDHNMEGFSLGPQYRILRAKDVMRLIGLSRSTVWNLMGDGKLHKQRHIGQRSFGWLDGDS
jgi:predicted DNA-binding transcriptional regulator AlpA